MGKRSFALGVLTALTAAAAAESTRPTTTYVHPTTTHTYVQGGTPVPEHHVIYTAPAPRSSCGTTSVARTAYGKMVKVYDLLDDGDVIEMGIDIGLELVSIWKRGETIRVSLSRSEREAVEAVITAFALPVTGSPSKLSASFAKAVRYI